MYMETTDTMWHIEAMDDHRAGKNKVKTEYSLEIHKRVGWTVITCYPGSVVYY